MRLFAPIAIVGVCLVAAHASAWSFASAGAAPDVCVAANHTATSVAPSATPVDPMPAPGVGGGSASQTISVRVPEGQLYLDPGTRDLELAASADDSTTIEPVLVADLRDPTPGWALSVWVDSTSSDGPTPDVVIATSITPVVGASCGAAAPPPVVLAPGRRAEVAVGASTSGWGSYNVTVSIRRVTSSAAGDPAASLRLHFELQSR